jgi:hypothetical protein
MPTDNPKISLYVPQQVFDRFKSFQEERKLSMSQAGIVILAEYFGIKETIKEITEGTTIGGVTLTEFEQLKRKIVELEKFIKSDQQVLNKTVFAEKEKVEPEKSTSSPQLKLISEEASLTVTAAILAKRFGLKTNSVSSAKSKTDIEGFRQWSKSKDPDNIGWIPKNKKDIISEEGLSSELLSKLQKWIADNT